MQASFTAVYILCAESFRSSYTISPYHSKRIVSQKSTPSSDDYLWEVTAG
jgi:hypothetical protein